jgi:hypothetical protein
MRGERPAGRPAPDSQRLARRLLGEAYYVRRLEGNYPVSSSGADAVGEELTRDKPEIQKPSDSTEDDGLILWMLSLTPTQRLEFAQGFIDSIQVLRNGRRA